MKLKKFFKGILLVSIFILSSFLMACSQSKKENSSEEKVLKVGMSFNIAALNPHKDSNAWLTNIYGVTETLFKINEDLSLSGLLAKEYKNNGNIWQITLKDNLKFSNGNSITSKIVIANIERLASENKRFKDFSNYEYTIIDDKTFEINTKVPNPILINDLASPEVAIIDLDSIKDFNTEIIASGPFVVETFIPNGNVTLKKNNNYWNGDVKLDKAEFIYFQDPNAKQLALQNGEIDTYYDVRVEANEIFGSDKNFVINRVPGTRIQFMILNEKRLDTDLRKAINMAIDKKTITKFLKGILSETSSPFTQKAAYGKAKDTDFNLNEAKKIIEAKGYLLNSEGFYEKDGKILNIDLAYYAARSLDVTATLLYEQLKAAGIKLTLKVYEDPDATYISTSDFDLALYSMIADKAGDPYYFINSTIKDGAYYDVGGFNSDEAENLINQLKEEANSNKRAELANKILQIVMDDNAFTYIGQFSRSVVYRKEVSGLYENIPFDFYLINANTNIGK